MPQFLQGTVNQGQAGASAWKVTLYDNTAASGTILWTSGAMGALTTPFFTGLTLVISGANSTTTLIYE